MTYAIVTQRFLAYFKEIAALDQSHYPERMAQCFIINVPYVFWVVWAMVKPWLNKHTVAKIQIFAGNYQSTLQEYVHPSQLPEEYGGTNGSLVQYYEQVFQKARLLGVDV
ncbi:hypothetical protein CYMTET_22289 [Cymbomonas tetramitiformis]|uniref:CRAL-TRIO domain-containing protein n=1 Tax=Cymbomonas tetramitiformis TaxID=36881 RepID=A0AAE0G0Q3_9CHLO|nr:hypothetical protein CYMTET_22289 [Cymbomonas tetramitiformis]